ncbi:MAG: polysaccharide deacetylase family protein [Bacteroidia bacterium]|nr:polysaccharide deacetylase family protein [Bacteroidia bacterium]
MPFTPQPGEFFFRRYAEAVWHGNRNRNEIFLTFDDGPTPGITERVLDKLARKNIKAHFFCIGKNVEKEKSLFNEILAAKHVVGNHTYSHLNLFRASWSQYQHDILRCHDVFPSNLFRPPYGRITRSAIRRIKALGFQTILWDVITYDFSQTSNAEHCKKIIRKYLKPGSIIVFHDSVKAAKNMLEGLDFLLTYAECRRFEFSLLNGISNR